MKDYSKTIMYKIIGSGMTYYGHTTKTLERRKSLHIAEAKSSRKSYCTSKLIIDAGDFEMIEIEKYPCANKKEAHAREGWWITNNGCINKVIPGRTDKEYMRAYNEANRDHLLAQQKAYREAHKAEKAAYMKAYDDTHKAEIAAQKRAYNEANRDHISAQKKAYHEAHKAELAEYDKAYREAHKAEIAEYKKAYTQWNKSWDGLNKIKI